MKTKPIFDLKDLNDKPEEIRVAYEREGWVVVKKLIPIEKIQESLEGLHRIKTKRPPILTQNSHEWTRPKIENGQMLNSIQSPSKHLHLGKSRKSIINVISDQSISDALKIVTGHSTFVQWQDMLFDKSTGTADHFDSYYLDTSPNGNMVAAWIALEDIHADAGPFFTISQSQEERLNNIALKGLPHADFVARCFAMSKANDSRRYTATLEKGDVLLWNALTLHGADEPENDSKTRKSITCHYYPLGMKREKKPTDEAVRLDQQKMLSTNNPNIFLSNSFGENHIRFTFFGLRRFLKESLTRRKYRHTIMNRSEYKL